jgi:uncharacterized integral membrane protein
MHLILIVFTIVIIVNKRGVNINSPLNQIQYPMKNHICFNEVAGALLQG